MTSNLPQFDILLGGNEELPQDLTIMNYASARAQEILSLAETLQDKKAGLVFQRLPRHMRRRVMSHNAKRMPRQLREAHIRQMEKSGLPPKPKRPSRKYRRRPSNLLEAYNRRQREFIWLETHIWHAKRFHMTSKWGYKLANFPNDKSARACYRGASNHCLIQDISYYICIELKGGFDCITNGLRMLTRDECGLTFGAKVWQKGDREGSVTIFHHGAKYPHGAIGRMLFLWKPMTSPDNIDSGEPLAEDKCITLESDVDVVAESNKERAIWIWVHPSYYDEVKEELLKVFEMELCPYVAEKRTTLEPPRKKVKLDDFKTKSKPKNPNLEASMKKEGNLRVSYELVPHYEGSNVKMALLKDTLVRFRLTGPLSQAVLRETFLLAPTKGEKNESFPWWVDWKHELKCQRDIWETMAGITSPAMVSPHMVMGLTILDPRCNLPEKRTKALDLDYIYESDTLKGCLPPDASASPIWNDKIRDYVTKFKPRDAELNKKQSDNLVPGIIESEERKYSGPQEHESGLYTRVPILLIQRPGSQDSSSKRLGYCSGWDVIAPAEWGKPLWLGLMLRGARAGGLRESEMVEDIGFSQALCWPALPDTNAAKAEMKQREREAREKYFRLPTNKRPNYVKLGICSPFSCPWNILCREWSDPTPCSGSRGAPQLTPYVLRELKKLREISKIICEIKNERNKQHNLGLGRMGRTDSVKEKASFREWLGTLPGLSGDDCCLIPIRVTICKKGIVKDFAIICLPIKEDLVNHKSKQSAELKGPEEPINLDLNQEERKKLRKEHKRNLLSLRRKRIKQRKESDEFMLEGDEQNSSLQEASEQTAIPRRPTMGPTATADLREGHKNKMEELFLPPVTQVRKSCSREVAGYVTHGIFSFSDAKEIGMAYIALPALLSLLETKFWNPELLVLVRNTYCKHYIPAKVEIITN